MRHVRFRTFLACLAATALLASCGGGGDGGSPAVTSPSPLASLQAKARVRTDPTLVPGPVSMVNTTTEGQQVLRTMGATSDGGYTVAWLSADATLSMQHYDSDGLKDGGETPIPLTIPETSPEDAMQAIKSSSLAVLTDGSVVVAYLSRRPLAEPTYPGLLAGVYFQRFDASGAQVAPEVKLDQDTAPVCGFRCFRFVGRQQVTALADGGFVVGWAVSLYNDVGEVTLRRHDVMGQQVGGASDDHGQSSLLGYGITPDARGGFTLRTTWVATTTGQMHTTIRHYDVAGNTQFTVIPPAGAVSLLLLPVEGGYILFSGGVAGTVPTRQMLDSAGNPVGEPSAIPTFPLRAQELSDGSYVLVTSGQGALVAQRFTRAGDLLGQAFGIPGGALASQMTALADPGFAVAWTGSSESGDSDVYTQRFVEDAKGQKKSCLDAAKAQRLRGKERKAFIDACVGRSGPA